jgi:hypothetical protein
MEFLPAKFLFKYVYPQYWYEMQGFIKMNM